MSDPMFFDSTSGTPMWRCIRCASEYPVLGEAACYSVKVGADTVGFCCERCRDVVKDEIRRLLPELSCHGVPAGENDPGWPDGTPPAVMAAAEGMKNLK